MSQVLAQNVIKVYLMLIQMEGGRTMTLGERIRFRREQLNMTQEQLGEKIGVRVATISRYESGTIASPPQDKLARIMAALKVDANYLIDDETSTTDSIDEIKEQLRRRPGMRILFSASKNVSEADLLRISKMIKAMAEDGGDNDTGG